MKNGADFYPRQVRRFREKLGGWLGFEVEFDDDFVADEVVGFAWVVDVEIFAVDVEFGGDFEIGLVWGDGGGEVDAFGDAVEGEVAGYLVEGGVLSVRGEVGDVEGRLWEFFYVEEIGRFEVAGEFWVVGEGGGHVDDDFVVVAGRFAVFEIEVASEGFEAADVAAGDF